VSLARSCQHQRNYIKRTRPGHTQAAASCAKLRAVYMTRARQLQAEACHALEF
jgi:hypothetical protein